MHGNTFGKYYLETAVLKYDNLLLGIYSTGVTQPHKWINAGLCILQQKISEMLHAARTRHAIHPSEREEGFMQR